MRSRPWFGVGLALVGVAVALLGWKLWASSQVPDLLVLRPVERKPLGPGLDGSGLSRAARAPREGGGRILGSVTRSGRPEVAEILVRRLSDGRRLGADAGFLFEVDEETRPTHATRSAEDGTFALGGLARGTWQLLARASDGARGWGSVMLARDGETATCDVELRGADHVLRGTVRDQHGAPWGRTIAAVAPSVLAFSGGDALSVAAIDPEGRFALSGLPAFEWGLALEGEGVLRAAVFGVRTPREVPLDVRVRRPDAQVVVRVVEARGGAAVRGASVGALWFENMTLACNQGTTDASGITALAVATPCEVTVHADGYAPAAATAQPGTTGLTIGLRRASRVVGRALRSETREGIPGLRVGLSDPLSQSVLTDPQGRYAIEGVPPGLWRIQASGVGWVSLGQLDARADEWDPRRIEVLDGVEVEHDILVEPAARLEGRVLDPTGVGLAGARVEVRDRDVRAGNEWDPPDGVTTDESGRYSIESLPPDADVALVASAPGHGAVTSPVLRTVAGSTTLDLTLTAARWLEVRVHSERDDVPLPGAEVSIRRAHLAYLDVRTDGDGRARAGPLREGDALHVSAEGHVSQRLETPTGEALVLRLAPGLPIAGRVVDADGTPIVGGVVSIDSEEHDYVETALTGADGRFGWAGVAPGAWDLSVHARGHRAEVQVEAGTIDVELRLPAPDRSPPVLSPDIVRVRVSVASGEPASSGRVALLHAGDSSQARFEEGNVALSLPRSTSRAPFHVVVWEARDENGLLQGPASAGPFPVGQREVDVTLPPALTLVGWIEGLPAGLAPGVVVEAYPYLKTWGWAQFLRAAPADLEGLKLPDDGKLTARCAADGSFRIGGLADMPFALVALLPPGWYQDDEVVAEPGDVVRLEVRRGVDVVVTVLGGTGEPLSGAEVSANFDVDHPPHEQPLWNAHRSRSERHTDAQGRIRMRGLRPDAVYALYVEPPDKGLHFTHYDKEWEPSDTIVRLRPAHLVEGTVRDGAGRPVKEAAVALWIGAKRKLESTDEQGRFRFQTLPAGSFPVQAARSYADLPDDPGPEATTLAAGTRDADFVIDPGVALVLQPSTPGPSIYRTIRVYAREGGALREVRDESKEFGAAPTRLLGMAPRRPCVVWIPPDREDRRYGLVEVADPEAGPVIVPLQDGATLRLRVEGFAEFPEVEWGSATSEVGLQLRLLHDAQGKVQGIPPGRWTLNLRLREAGRRVVAATVEVGTADFDVTLLPK